MGITGCILAKNEENNLRGCIESIKDFVNEIIVVDNESTDNTCSIAHELGCKVVKFRGQNESAARNVYLDESTQPWILVLDADERFVPESCDLILDNIKKASDNTLGFIFPRFEYHGEGKWACTTLMRLTRNHSKIRYKDGKIHPTLVPAIKELDGNVECIYLPIHHLDILQKKRTSIKRSIYTARLEEAIKNNRDDLYDYRLHNYLGVEYTALGRYDEAEFEYKKAKELSDRAIPLANVYLAQNYILKNDLDMAKYEAELIFKTKSYCVDNCVVNEIKERAYSLLAEIAVRQNRIVDAICICEEAINKNPLAPHSYINAASLLEKRDPRKAIDYIYKAIKLNPYLEKEIIYKKGETPNIFLHQTSFLSTTRTVFEHLEECYKNLGQYDLSLHFRKRRQLMNC